MSQTSFIQSTRAETRKHGVEARSEVSDLGQPRLIQKGTVLAVTGSTYTVGIGPSDAPYATYTRVFCEPAGTVSAGASVILIFQPGTTQPFILNTGGGSGGSCITSIHIGVYTD